MATIRDKLGHRPPPSSSALREEGVTIHAAISAALTIAGRAIDESWRNNPLRIMSPAEIRDILGLKDQCMVSFGGGEISIAPGSSMTFWDLARFAKDGLSAVKSAENISRMIDLQSQPSPPTLPSNRRFNSSETRSTHRSCFPISAVSRSTAYLDR
jgi:hypothetical protein